ncbi:tigger transposable element-derived protein 1 [Trichonephila clavipes]|uniref:Tigger transposable element-derived protein 1 n=1 Tax=Trichonephila clavipes TaxID=2585209 RepID=A0A8X6S657_TRICX|nr:tigger transposable element-derived protein 1 [Trichonephila clavipes]
MDSDVVQELEDSHNEELTTDELIEMHELEQDIEELGSLNPVQLEDRMTFGNWTEDLSLIEKGSNFKKINTPTKRVFFQQKRDKKLLACNEEILKVKKLYDEIYSVKKVFTHIDQILVSS